MDTLAWERLEEYIALGRPSLLPVGGTRGVLIGYNPSTPGLFIRLELPAGASAPISPYAELGVEERVDGERRYLEIGTHAPHLFREFHRLSSLLAEEFERPQQTAVGAFTTVIARWRELTNRRELLSEDEQLGLLGELSVLKAILRYSGSEGISSWTGRVNTIPDRHDFRLGSIDLEVKSTRSGTRRHIIHGLRQLEPSGSNKLMLLSLRYDAAGQADGSSLAELVSEIVGILTGRHAYKELNDFEGRLAGARYRHVDGAHYGDRFRLADRPVLVPVDEHCPRITALSVNQLLGPELASRVGSDVVYRINVDGLGAAVDQYRNVLPALSTLT